jgi:Obg family GTPase CgtA-like protein
MRVGREDGAYVVSGEGVERLALKTDWATRRASSASSASWRKIGVVGALRRAGAEPGDEDQDRRDGVRFPVRWL